MLLIFGVECKICFGIRQFVTETSQVQLRQKAVSQRIDDDYCSSKSCFYSFANPHATKLQKYQGVPHMMRCPITVLM